MLAESDRLEDGGKTIVITLRQGVKFHNGKEMTADDVVASHEALGRIWRARQASDGERHLGEATGKYEVTLSSRAERRLEEPDRPRRRRAGIYPAEIASKAGNQPIEQKDYIGTGPYKFKEWRPNRYVELDRFDGYEPRSEQADGYAGARVANFDTIRFFPVPDVGTRVSGVQAGDYDYAEMISGDLYDTLSRTRRSTSIATARRCSACSS